MRRSVLNTNYEEFRENYLNHNQEAITLHPIKNKEKILNYLRERTEPGVIEAFYCKDPITGKVISDGSAVYEADGFIWSTGTIHVFEKYDARLSDEFLELFN